jgi:hypothetical protein
MLPTVPVADARSIWSSAMMPSSMRATRVSRMSQLMTKVFRAIADKNLATLDATSALQPLERRLRASSGTGHITRVGPYARTH